MNQDSHSVSVRGLDLDFGSVSVLKNLNIDIRGGEFLVLLGSSGCGKSTLLNCIAGLLDVSDGQIFINNQNVTWAEPSARGIGMVFQSYALYPQMTVEGNLSFGLKNARMPRNEIRQRVERAAEVLQIEPLLKRKPAALSGGQRQRVAIGRALVRDVDVFLFDEPLSNLDAKLRADLRVELKRLHKKLGTTIVYVTHDQIEAMTLADRIAIMRAGSIQQLGTPDEIYRQPATRYVGGFIGSPPMNFIDGRVRQGRFECDGISLDLSAYTSATNELPDSPTTLGIRPEHVIYGPASSSCGYQAVVTPEIIEPTGADSLILTSIGDAPFRIRADGQSEFSTKQSLNIGFDSSSVSLFDTESGQRI